MSLPGMLLAGMFHSIVNPFSDTAASMKFMATLTDLGRKPLNPTRVGRVVQNMRDSGFNDHEILIILTALHDQTSFNLKRAFRIFQVDQRSPFIRLDEFRRVAMVLGEDRLESKDIEELFSLVDEDKSGTVEFDEFCTLFRALGPAVEQQSQLGTMMANLTSLRGSSVLSESWVTLSKLDVSTQMRLKPMQLAKVGRVIQNMEKAHYTTEEINIVARALFVQGDEDMEKAFGVFDTANKGALDALQFRTTLPLLGEDVSDEEIDDLFRLADEDGSGLIELGEFTQLIKAMNDHLNAASGRALKMKERVAEARALAEEEEAARAAGAGLSRSLSRMSFGSMQKQDVMARVSMANLAKSNTATANMKQAGFSDGEIDVVIEAVFVEQTDEAMFRAFDVFDRNLSGYVKLDQFEQMLTLLGENVPRSKLDALFAEVDTNRDGKLEAGEFVAMMKALNPQGSGSARKLRHAGLSDKFAALSVMGLCNQMRMAPVDVTRMGKLVSRMLEERFSNVDINTVTRAVFLSQEPADLRDALRTFTRRFGELDHETFKKVVVLLGEEPEDDEEALKRFQQFDQDGSGVVDAEEFAHLVRKLHPTPMPAIVEKGKSVRAIVSSRVLHNLNPLQTIKAQRIISALLDGGLSKQDVREVVSGVLLEREPAIEDVFAKLSDLIGKPVDTDERFAQLLKFIGEEFSPLLTAELFSELRSKKSRALRQSEFVHLVQVLNPRGLKHLGIRLVSIGTSIQAVGANWWDNMQVIDARQALSLTAAQLAHLDVSLRRLRALSLPPSAIQRVVALSLADHLDESVLVKAFAVLQQDRDREEGDQEGDGIVRGKVVRSVLPMISSQRVDDKAVDQWYEQVMGSAPLPSHKIGIEQFEVLVRLARGESPSVLLPQQSSRTSFRPGARLARRTSVLVSFITPWHIVEVQIRRRLGKRALGRAGTIVLQLHRKGVDLDSVNMVLRSVMLQPHNDQALRDVFVFFDAANVGYLSVGDMHRVLTLLGERCESGQVESLLSSASDFGRVARVKLPVFVNVIRILFGGPEESSSAGDLASFVPGVSSAVLYSKVLRRETREMIGASQIPQIVGFIREMQFQCFSNSEIDKVVCAMYSQNPLHLQEAFGVFVWEEDEELEGDEIEEALVFAHGVRRLVRVFKPNPDDRARKEIEEELESTPEVTFEGFKLFLQRITPKPAPTPPNALSKMVGGMASVLSAVSVLDTDCKQRVGMLKLHRVGKALEQLADMGIEPHAQNAAVRLFVLVDISDDDIRTLFAGLEQAGQGHVRLPQLKKVLEVFEEQGFVHHLNPEGSKQRVDNLLVALAVGRDESKVRLTIKDLRNLFVILQGATQKLRAQQSRKGSALALAFVEEEDDEDVEDPLEPATRTGIARKDRDRVDEMVRHMQKNDCESYDIDLMVRVLFVGRLSDVRECFEYLDKSKDGELERPELVKFLHLLGVDVGLVDSVMDEVDADRSNEVEWPEFVIIINALQSERARSTFLEDSERQERAAARRASQKLPA